MFSRYLRSVVEWEILVGPFAFGSVMTASIGHPESTVGEEGETSGLPDTVILLFGWERLWEELGRLGGLTLPEFALARGNCA